MIGHYERFQKYEIDFRHYISFRPGHVVAMQTFAEINDGDIPFYQLACFGSDSFRGHYLGRYRDKSQFYTTIEYRFPVYNKFGLATFAGLGDVVHDWSKIQFSDLKHDFGMGLRYEFDSERRNKNGYVSRLKNYVCEDCSGCTLKEQCTRSRGNRRMEVSPNLERHKQIARERLTSEAGLGYRSRRPIEVESVFGHIKQNRGFRRFLLRGLKKVETEWGLLSVAHNLLKMWTLTQAKEQFS